MNSIMWIQIIGYAATFFSLVRAIPQIFKIFCTRNSNDISHFSVIMGIFYSIIFTICGIILKDSPILITNSVLVFINFILLIFIFTFKIDNNIENRHKLENEYFDLKINDL